MPLPYPSSVVAGTGTLESPARTSVDPLLRSDPKIGFASLVIPPRRSMVEMQSLFRPRRTFGLVDFNAWNELDFPSR